MPSVRRLTILALLIFPKARQGVDLFQRDVFKGPRRSGEDHRRSHFTAHFEDRLDRLDSAVHDERTLLSHERDFTHVDIIFTNLRDEISLDNRSTPPLAVLVNQSGKTHEITRKTQ